MWRPPSSPASATARPTTSVAKAASSGLRRNEGGEPLPPTPSPLTGRGEWCSVTKLTGKILTYPTLRRGDLRSPASVEQAHRPNRYHFPASPSGGGRVAACTPCVGRTSPSTPLP